MGSWLLGAPGPCSAAPAPSPLVVVAGEGEMETQVQSPRSAKSLEKNLSPISLFKNFLIKPFVFAVISSSCRPRIFQALSHPAPRGSGELRGAARPAEGDHTLRGLYCSRGGRFLGLFFRLFLRILP